MGVRSYRRRSTSITRAPPSLVDSDRVEARELSSIPDPPPAWQLFPPIYAVALAILAGDALGNFHVVISIWLAVVVAIIALAAMLQRRTTLGLAAAYLAIMMAAIASVARVLDPPMRPDRITALIDGSPVTIEGRLLRESEHEPYGERLYVKVTRAAEKNEPLRSMRGTVRVAVLGGGEFRLGDEIRMSARIHFPHNYGNPGEFDFAAQMAREGIDATITASRNSKGTPALEVIGHRSSFPASESNQ